MLLVICSQVGVSLFAIHLLRPLFSSCEASENLVFICFATCSLILYNCFLLYAESCFIGISQDSQWNTSQVSCAFGNILPLSVLLNVIFFCKSFFGERNLSVCFFYFYSGGRLWIAHKLAISVTQLGSF